MAGNFEERVANPLKFVTGPLPGERLLKSFKEAMVKENVFKMMFGDLGQRIFENKRPNLNDTILPLILLSWRSETYSSNNVYLDGTIDMFVVLPSKLHGDYNSQRRVASMIQRWMGGSMNLWADNPGLIKFGYGTEWTFADLLEQDGMSAPVMIATVPFRFDLEYMRRETDYDPNAPLDDADTDFIQSMQFNILDAETRDELLEVKFETKNETEDAGG